MSVQIIHGDSREQLPLLEADSIDAVITDPPYALTANKRGGSGVASISLESPYGRARIGVGNGAGGFMGKKWDTGETAFDPAFWSEVLRVMKPGAHLIAFGGTRTYHRLVCSIEDAGFEIRDQLAWLFGSGFPKSHNVAKALQRLPILHDHDGNPMWCEQCGESHGTVSMTDALLCAECAATELDGIGTALKPAQEPICLARKPLESTVAANVIKHGTGGLNIAACRVETDGRPARENSKLGYTPGQARESEGKAIGVTDLGRWPANVIHDGSPEVLAGFPVTESSLPGNIKPSPSTANAYGDYATRSLVGHVDQGSAARFFYTPKADKLDRLESKHPTVKPIDLMAYLIKLVTPPGGTVLDPFAGSGSTGMAAMREGFNAILIEREAEYVRDIQRRLDHVHGHDTPLFAEIAS